MAVKEMKKNSLAGSSIKGGLCGSLAALLLLYIAAMLIQRELLPYGLQEELVIASAFLGAAVGGLTAALWQGRGVITAGMASGAVYFLLMTLISAFFGDGRILSVMTVKLLICAVAGGAFGGTLCISKKHKKRKTRY